MAFYHVSGGRAYGPSEPGESLKDYRARVRKAYDGLHGITFGTRDTIPLDGSGRKILEIPCGSQRSVTINAGR